MNELIKVNYEKEQPSVSGRELHEFLEVETPYHKWFPRMCEYGFVENQDYTVADIFVHNSAGGPQSQKDAAVAIPMAKELCMLQRTDKGKQARQYFISVEEAWNRPEIIMARALKMADARMKTLQAEKEQLQIEAAENKPKVVFADAVAVSKTSILVGELAKILKQNGIDIGQNRLFEILREKGYLIKRQGTDYNMPTQRSMEIGLFEIKETAITHSDGHVTISKTPKVTGRGQLYFINMFLSNPEWRAAA